MSARSPRGSLSGASSAEVAEDFGESLKDLQANNRYEINNLTLIAKECTEHAQAISKVLEKHIKTTAPPRKLPALYVLDSIVKNVGTPYTVYLGNNLYQTFMDAYTLVDANTRRSMEGMLKTWKEPVPGSLDSTPVFPPDIVRPIENALIKFRTVMVQNSRQSQAQLPPSRSTPTPPQLNGRYGVPSVHGQSQPYYAQSTPQPGTYQQRTFSPAPAYHQPLGYPAPQTQPVNDVEGVKRDVAAVIQQRQGQFAANPYNVQIRTELDALLQLQKVLNTQVLDASALQQVRNQISALAAAAPPQVQQPTPQPISTPVQWQPPVSLPQPATVHRPPIPYSQPPSTQPQQPAAPFLDPAALNGLQALLANGQKPSTPQMRAAAPALQNASHAHLSNVQNQASTLPNVNTTDLLASLAKSGLLQNLSPATPSLTTSAPPPPAQKSTADLLASLAGSALLSSTATPPQASFQPPPTTKPKIPFTTAALKTFRPELVHALYTAQPNQCPTCGRRFLATDEGRAKKARHLDWHFRTNQRMTDGSISRGVHRNWFVSELEWIRLIEFDPSTTSAADADAAAAAAAASGGAGGAGREKVVRPEERWVKAPPGVTRNVCSIDFEEMKSTFSEELQEWVFVNAAVVGGGKIVHATCLEEMVKGPQQGSWGAALKGLGAGVRRSVTPEGGLGKRKRED